jgi:uncharacterized protein with von Willebrand factor type A (vWA) domain/WD40 repeat protein
MNEVEQLPLWDLFHRLRKAGLPLEIDDYKLALQALQSGLGIEDKEALARLCRTLWVKSREENLLFNYHFEQVISGWKPPVPTIQSEIIPISPTRENRNLFPILKSKRFLAFGAFLLFLVIYGFISNNKSTTNTKQCPYFTSTPSTSVVKGQPYSYTAVACKAHETDPLPTIEVLNIPNKPSWLQVKPNPKNGTVKLEGTPKSNLFVWHPVIRRWDLTGREQGDGFIVHNSDVKHLNKDLNYHNLPFPKISPDGKYFLTQQYAEEFKNRKNLIINLLNSPDKNSIVLEHTEIPKEVVFSPDSEFLATVQSDGLVRIWDRRGKLLYPEDYKIDIDRIGVQNSIQFSSDGKHLTILETQQEQIVALILDLSSQTIETLVTIQNPDKFIDPAPKNFDSNHLESGFSMLSPSGKYIVRRDGASIILWNISEQKSVSLPDVGIVKEAVFSSNSESLAIIQEDNLVKIWDLKGKIQQKPNYLPFDRQKIPDLKFSSDGKHLAARTEDGTVYLSDLSGQHQIPLSESEVVDMNFSPNGKLLTTRSKDNIVKLWDVEGQGDKSRLTLDGTNYSVMFSPDGQSLISTSMIDYSTIKLQVKDSAGNVKDTQSFNLQVSPTLGEIIINTDKSIFVTIGFIISLFLLAIAYPIARWWLIRNTKFSTEEEPSIEPIDPPSPPLELESKPEPEDEIQVGKAIRGSRIETDEYFPITQREMKQSWRYLRRMVREGSATELDLEGTVRQISQQGLMLNLVLRPPRVNRAELLLLIDREGSMVPFHVLSRRLEETALQGGRLAKVGVYHFHNCPDDHLYNDPSRTEAMPIEAVLNAYSGVTGVLICSDAGSANGGFNPERVQLTEEFLERIKQRFRYVAWLNPMPIDRWQGTSAESIAKSVPMFEFSRQGLHQAIAILQGKLVPLSIKD